jgi:23S rRNA (guanosine2251-2'-O)-methyltransferase
MSTAKNDIYVIAHNIRSLYNVGAIFRTADALGINRVYITGYTGTPENPRLQKTSLGSQDAIKWEYHLRLPSLIKNLKKNRVQILALETGVRKATDIGKFRARLPSAILLGEEVSGIRQSHLRLADHVLEIPMLGQKESLNVSVAFGIAAYLISRQRSSKT